MLEKLPHAIGSALSGIRPGLGKTVYGGPDVAASPETIRVTSPAFTDGAPIPERHTEDGEGLSPPLAWTGVPEGTLSVVLLVEDADSPTPAPLVHAIVPSLPGQDGELPEAALPSDAAPDDGPEMGRNSFLSAEYLPPDPPPATVRTATCSRSTRSTPRPPSRGIRAAGRSSRRCAGMCWREAC